MRRRRLEPRSLKGFLKPESPLERLLLDTPEFQKGLVWGEPRFGHPEGQVGLHIREVLDNIDRIPDLSAPDRARLRLIAFSHDTFKCEEDRSNPRDWTRHHAVIAQRFMAQYTDDPIVLDIIEAHDDAYYAWLFERRASDSLRHKSVDALLQKVGYCLQLYYLFFKCDTQTGDKTQASVKWFEAVMPIDVVEIGRD